MAVGFSGEGWEDPPTDRLKPANPSQIPGFSWVGLKALKFGDWGLERGRGFRV